MLMNGTIVQKMSVARNLWQLSYDYHDDVIYKILPKLFSFVTKKDSEIIEPLCCSFAEIIRKDHFSDTEQTEHILPKVLQILKWKDSEAGQYEELLFSLYPSLPKDAIVAQVSS